MMETTEIDLENRVKVLEKELQWLERKREIETIGFNYQRYDFTKDELLEKYGGYWLETTDMSNDNLTDDDLQKFNDYDHRLFVENYHKIPKGLEKKVSLRWFKHFFNWDKDDFQVKIDGSAFKGNWLDVPFPVATQIDLCGMDTRFLEEPSYNWYELFIIMNDLMFRQGRLFDIGITSIDYKRTSFDEGIISVWWSS